MIMTEQNHPTKEALAKRIRTGLRKSAAAVIQAGKDLTEAREHACKDLTRQHWDLWLRDKCGITRPDAVKLMSIAGNAFIADGSNLNHLPKTQSALYALSKIDAGKLAEAHANGEITPGMTAKAVKALSGSTSKRPDKVTVQLYPDNPVYRLWLADTAEAAHLDADEAKAVAVILLRVCEAAEREAIRDILA
jgi:hypothetical protein